MLVFVYGTLKKGEGNHHLLKDATFVEGGYIKGELHQVHGLPALIEGTSYVPGELYEVDDNTLDRLDILEGYSTSVPQEDCLYVRRVTDVLLNDSCTPEKAFVYYWNDSLNDK